MDNKSDLASWIFSPLLFGNKKQIVSVTSPFQRIDIWDLLSKDSTPSYEDAKKAGLTEGDPRWLTSEVASPERIVFLDGHIQVRCDLWLCCVVLCCVVLCCNAMQCNVMVIV